MEDNCRFLLVLTYVLVGTYRVPTCLVRQLEVSGLAGEIEHLRSTPACNHVVTGVSPLNLKAMTTTNLSILCQILFLT